MQTNRLTYKQLTRIPIIKTKIKKQYVPIFFLLFTASVQSSEPFFTKTSVENTDLKQKQILAARIEKLARDLLAVENDISNALKSNNHRLEELIQDIKKMIEKDESVSIKTNDI